MLGFTFSFGAGTSVTGEGRVDGVTVNVTAPVAVEVPWTLRRWRGGPLMQNWNSGTVSGAGCWWKGR
jgi:hypothetical protein